jgi:hypothetical protein
MEDRAPKPDAIDQADAGSGNALSLKELMEGVAPITSWDDLDIPDLTDEEREAFARHSTSDWHCPRRHECVQCAFAAASSARGAVFEAHCRSAYRGRSRPRPIVVRHK